MGRFKIESIVHPAAKVLAEEHVCSICHCIYDDPVQLSECHHVFCSGCIERAELEACPECREPYGEPAWKPLKECTS